MTAIILLILWIVLCAADRYLYGETVRKHGPQWNYWPLSGFYVAWKNRNKPYNKSS